MNVKKDTKLVGFSKKHPRGLKLNKQLIREALILFEKGLTITDTCTILNIHRDTYYNWLKKAKTIKTQVEEGYKLSKEEELYLDVSDAHEKGLSLFKQKRLENIIDDQAWQSDAWLLERKFPNEFGRNQSPVIDNSKTEIKNVLILNDLGQAIAKELNRRSTQEITDRSTVTITETD